MQVSPVAPEPRPLDHWLDPGRSGTTAQPTVLAWMATRWSQRRGLVVTLWCWVVVGALSTLSTLLVQESGSAAVIGSITAALVLMAAVVTAYHRSHPLAPYHRLNSSRGPLTTRGGVLAAAVLLSAVLVMLIVSTAGADDVDTSFLPTSVLYVLGVAQMLVNAGWHTENAARLFRRHIGKDGRARARLEEMSLNPPVRDDGPRLFGPL